MNAPMQEQQNNPIFLRPRFYLELEEKQDVLLNKFKQAVQLESFQYKSKIVDHHIVIDFPVHENRYWSPQLHLEIEKKDKNHSIVRGLFGPKPEVWTLFIVVHFCVAITCLGFATLAYVQWVLKTEMLVSLVIALCMPFVWVALYIIGRIGKIKAQTQTKELHDFVTGILTA